jgi:hypothetical protein
MMVSGLICFAAATFTLFVGFHAVQFETSADGLTDSTGVTFAYSSAPSFRVVSFFTRQSEVAAPRSRSTCARANLHAEAHRAAPRLRARQVLPRNWTVFARERACRAVITDECETHGFARTLFHAARAVEIIQGRLCEAGIAGVDLDVRV